MSEQRVVVVGAGLAGTQVAQTLRDEGFSGTITLVGDEHGLPYDRTKLSKEYLQGRVDLPGILLHPDEWYDAEHLTLLRGETVVAIDRGAKSVRLASGASLAYDWLVLATGAAPRRIPLLGGDLPGVMALRSLGDSDALRELFASGGRLAVIGAGWIGLEAAAAAVGAGMSVSVIAPNNQPLDRVLGPTIGEHFANLHRRNGVDLRLGTTARGILERDGRAAGVRTDAGDVEADAVLVAVGATPRVELAEHAGIEVDRGVLTDEHLVTNDPAVLAVGDIADAWNTTLQTRIRREHWDNAIRQGALAAGTVLGRGGVYDWLPYFYTDQFDLGMEYVGDSLPTDDVVVRGTLASGEFIAFWLRDGVVTAGMNVNVWDVNETLRGLVGRQVDPARLADPGVDLSELLTA
ncbi:FAD-dependent oxidoreductase [Brooklawnia cerclae]|uniref:3-phenylpropionate/trans-cinnamate dioxygenase ferredoxin reductase subunit n=1 Tax=Brooklawnia cerclae TaxID=349934 RepID=A0ABX0SIM9_9ACTN|nr:FAD-dependent oxidoreductase [Brooklawnia cerclae]NIH58194.1 3-phenylpropionate/trans-cinnamate dioxygenase ferredoxin reductase subunit [Brooklawnia cerclae]